MWRSHGTGVPARERARVIGAWRVLGLLACLGAAFAATAGPASAAGNATCSGTELSPGTLAGTYGNVTINGVCQVNGGPATVRNNLTITPGSALIAAFAQNDLTGTGSSSLTVDGNLTVQTGAVLVMGCEPDFFPCFDDPNAGTGGTLTSSSTVQRNLASSNPAGVIVHATTIDGNLTESGGGGGLDPNCSFDYVDYEDNVIGGNLAITGVQTCWLGMLRNKVAKNLTANNNTTLFPNGNELVSNTVARNISCVGDSPAPQFNGSSPGATASSPNTVGHNASGQCGFDVLQPDPQSGGTLTPISIRG